VQSYRIGRCFFESIPTDSDLIDYIKTQCLNQSIQTAGFTVMGTVTFATIGVYDPKQQVYVTHVEKKATEVISCIGHLTRNEGKAQVAAKIILAGQQGELTGGHLFAPTLVQKAEIDLQELIALNS
jgi:predicted DNA-binding protein with PD1-like motif